VQRASRRKGPPQEVESGGPGSDSGLGGCGSGATADQHHKCDFSVDVLFLSRKSHRPNSPGRAILLKLGTVDLTLTPDCSALFAGPIALYPRGRGQ